AEKIAELKQTISSLLDNLPGMNYTIDAETGVYLACNQAFAEYAHKKSPEEVVGLKAAEIFDPVTAGRFADEDRVALSMDGPYIFFEDVSDAAGNRRQLQTTKLKYVDASGRQCLLGISQDVTDMVRIRRENAMTKEAYEKARSTGLIYNYIAQALARGYTDLYYINLDSEEFIEYRSDGDTGSLTEARRGYHFFEECSIEAEELVHPDDREAVLKALDRKTLVAALDRNRTFVMTYRLLMDGRPTYVTMRISRMEDDDRCIILGVTNVDEEMKQRHAAERMKEEKLAFSRLNALTGDFLCVYVVVPETGRYRQFSASTGFEAFGLPREGSDFFADSRDRIRGIAYPDDLNRFLSAFTRENVMADVGRYGIFTLSYRILMGGKPLYVQLKAAMVEEKEGKRLIVGINDIDAQVRQEEEYVKSLAQARIEANVDPLTGVRNRHAYLVAEERLNQQLEANDTLAFAVVILDVNDLKLINDRDGHAAGDQYLKDACKIICDCFRHSPVYRIGGDEFAVIVQGRDYLVIDDLTGQMAARNAEALRTGGIVIACCMARREGDAVVASVFERADQNMYENKNRLKAGN
ncbi:MAG: diguanylate cyclase, partial [Oscillospiraceae bacterium]|nr:diguanylate cyclase [Oscillospiraceae bacterium]